MPCAISTELNDGRVAEDETKDYEGFLTRPIPWNSAVEKFEGLAGGHASQSLRKELIEVVEELEDVRVSKLTTLLGKVRTRASGTRRLSV